MSHVYQNLAKDFSVRSLARRRVKSFLFAGRVRKIIIRLKLLSIDFKAAINGRHMGVTLGGMYKKKLITFEEDGIRLNNG